MNRPWLRDWPWETVVTINSGLCKEKASLHKPTSEGYELARKLWEESRPKVLSLREALEICRRCHKISPFCFYNGNTFAAVGRVMVGDILRKLKPVKAHAFRSVVGHYIAGTAGDQELDQVLADLPDA
jgi:hypothetical protein